MECRPPAMQMFFSSARAWANDLATSSRLSTRLMAKTRCALCWPWTSLTRMPGGGLSFFAACAKAPVGAAAASPATLRNVLRFRFFSSNG